MAKVFQCRTVGVECDYAITGDSEEEMIRQAYDHACIAHGVKFLLPEIEERIRSGIRDVPDSQVAGITNIAPPNSGVMARLLGRLRADPSHPTRQQP